MMKKRFCILAGLLCLALTLSACGHTDISEYYENAQLYLGYGDYEYAAELFSQLGEYEDAADYALYCRALEAIDEEDFDLARANLTAINPFKSSGRYLMYLDALELEEEGELDKALALYEKLGTFMEADFEVVRLKTAIPEAALKEGRTLMAKGEYEAAREIFLSLEGYGASTTLADNCTAALNKAAYNAADALFEAGDLSGALEAFTAMGDTLDASARAEACLTAIHEQLDKQYAEVSLTSAMDLVEAYQSLGEDEVAKGRIDELTARFGKNLELVAMDMPRVLLGSYPHAESGEEHEVMWRVIGAEGSVLTLLSEYVLDAAQAPQPISINMKEEELASAVEVTLPSMADVATMGDAGCTATPYAQAQGVNTDESGASYWLRDGLENGLYPVVDAEGALTLPGLNEIPGVRPLLTLSLENFTFNTGSGTLEDPFRIE